jgi:hypothetical protein
MPPSIFVPAVFDNSRTKGIILATAAGRERLARGTAACFDARCQSLVRCGRIPATWKRPLERETKFARGQRRVRLQ